MKKRILSLLLCMVVTITSEMVGFDIVTAKENEKNYVEITETKEIEDISDTTLNELDAIVISEDLENQDIDELNEVMDNGTGIIVDDMSVSDVQDYFDVDTITEYENEMGCYVYKDGDTTEIVPLEAQILIEEESTEKITNQDYKDLIESAEVDYNQVVEDYEKLNSTDKISKVDKEILPTLQGSTSIGSAFVDNDKFVYFFKKGSSGGTGKTYAYAEKSAIDGWSRMASLSFSIYAIKIKTREKTITYDNVFAVTVATAYKGKSVDLFKNGLSYNEAKNCKIIDYTDPEGNADSSVSGSIGTGVDSSGNTTLNYTTSYSYNPNGMDITPTKFSNRVRWTCDPLSSKKDASWKIKPGILLKKTDGTKSPVKVTSYVSYFQLWGGLRHYTLESTVSCSIKFKNHKKV